MLSIFYVIRTFWQWLLRIICHGLKLCGGGNKVASLSLSVSITDGETIEGVSMSIVARNDQVVTFKVNFRDSFGNIVDLLGSVPAWSVSDSTLGTLTTSDDGLQAVFTPSGIKGSVQVSVLVDADPGAAEEALVGTADITVLSGKATVVQLEGILSDRQPATPAPTPTPTEAPAPTEEPAPTEAPAPTAEPEATQEPAATEAPAETAAPEQP